MKRRFNYHKKLTLKIKRTILRVLVLNQSPISTIAQLARSSQDQKVALSGQFLYKHSAVITQTYSGYYLLYQRVLPINCLYGTSNLQDLPTLHPHLAISYMQCNNRHEGFIVYVLSATLFLFSKQCWFVFSYCKCRILCCPIVTTCIQQFHYSLIVNVCSVHQLLQLFSL